MNWSLNITYIDIFIGKLKNILNLFTGVTVTAGLISYPIDTIRRRMMMTSGQAVKYDGAIDCTRQILANEGFMSMMKGNFFSEFSISLEGTNIDYSTQTRSYIQKLKKKTWLSKGMFWLKVI